MKTTIFVLLLAMALSACAPATTPASPATAIPAATQALSATKVPDPTQAPVNTKAPVPTATIAPTATTAPTIAPTAVPPSNTPTVEANSLTPNDATLARLRVTQCVPSEPDMDVLMNGKVPVTAGVPISLAAGDVSRYEYLTPGTVRVAVVPSGMGMDKAFLAPLDVKLEAGHRYTLVVLGQPDEPTHKSLLIDETKAYQKAGGTPSSTGHITVNNIKGASTLSFLQDGVGEKDVPYGGFAASAHPAGNFKSFVVSVGDKVVEDNGGGSTWPGSDNIDCFYGSYSSTSDTHDTHSGASTSGLIMIDYLQGLTAEHAKNGGAPSFANFLAAVKTAGLTDQLTTGGPYLVFVPTDAAFAALPKEQLDALLADPKALGDLARAHIGMGYYPTGTLGQGTFDRTITNLLGKQLVLSGQTCCWESFAINGVTMGLFEYAMVANGTRLVFITKLIDPAAK